MSEIRTARTGEKVVRHTYYIEPQQVKWLRVTAAREDVDASALLREAIRHFKNTRPRGKAKRKGKG